MPRPSTTGRTLEATARWTAAVRAAESARPDRMFEDPWAAALAGPEGAAWLAERSPAGILPIALRTRFFDGWLERVTRDAGIRQVVLLAAGLDTRAFRLAWPEGTTVFELDRAAVLEHKERVLAADGARPGCARRTVEADLAGPWPGPLVEAGLDAERPAAWLLEGLLFYLPGGLVGRLLDHVTELAAPGSHLGFDAINSLVLTSPWTRPWVEMQAAAGAPWIGTMDDPVGALAARGWTASLAQPGEPGATHERWTLPVAPPGVPGAPRTWYVTAERAR
jgi:methyltransferase (TIGR00027 family)